MNQRDGLLFWSIPCGTWFATRVRVSVYFPLIAVLLLLRFGVQQGLLFAVILFGSVLLHEFGHVFAARSTGGSGDDILIWPLGGLAWVQPVDRLSARIWTSAAGPLTNLAVCAVTYWPVSQTRHLGAALNPLVLPGVALTDNVGSDLFVLIFAANWVLFLANLVPVAPLDGGRIVQAILADRLGPVGSVVYLRIGFFLAFAVMIVGLYLDNAWVVALGAIVLVLNMQETMHLQQHEPEEESFMGYDFSQGYTSLERDVDEVAEQPRRAGFFEQWRERRRRQREERLREREAREEARLDELLAKVQNAGITSLTDSERRFLDRASRRYRTRGGSPEE